ncbi:NADP-dependent isocitrate dehydrogenase [Kitasatospora albolonga]|uniref:NADP-dependent isocitrate dehydrogenase n=1 Tax=Kitasatospora albolonga TaxID=68173 RepID=UPI003CD06CAC
MGQPGELLALAASFEHLAQTTGNARAQVLADTLDRATAPSSTRTSRRAAASVHRQPRQPLLPRLYWARSWRSRPRRRARRRLHRTSPDPAEQEETIVAELIAVQGAPAEIGATTSRRPSLAARP